MITIIDYECGNLRSVQQAVEACGADVIVSSDIEDIFAADQLILPGVGAFPVGMTNLRRLGLDQVIRERVQTGTPLLGICLGMQLLFESSTEHGGDTGLGVIPGQVVQIKVPDRKVKLPNVGWVPLQVEKADVLLQENDYFYFVHSFHAQPQDTSVVLATAEYVTKVHAICMKCGDLANHSHRFEGSDSLVELGEKGNYEPLCRRCFTKEKERNHLKMVKGSDTPKR